MNVLFVLTKEFLFRVVLFAFVATALTSVPSMLGGWVAKQL